MTHVERLSRRRRVAAFVREHGTSPETLARAMKEFGVSRCLVRTACAEFGVDLGVTFTRNVNNSTLKIVADLVNTPLSLTALSDKYGVSVQRISYLYLACRRAGVPVRERVRGRPRT